jgi:predicted phosphatase
MESSMKPAKMPKFDSIKEMATYWDEHDLTDFEDALHEVDEAVFDRHAAVTVQLDADDLDALRVLARSSGLSEAALIRKWVLERLHAA